MDCQEITVNYSNELPHLAGELDVVLLEKKEGTEGTEVERNVSAFLISLWRQVRTPEVRTNVTTKLHESNVKKRFPKISVQQLWINSS